MAAASGSGGRGDAHRRLLKAARQSRRRQQPVGRQTEASSVWSETIAVNLIQSIRSLRRAVRRATQELRLLYRWRNNVRNSSKYNQVLLTESFRSRGRVRICCRTRVRAYGVSRLVESRAQHINVVRLERHEQTRHLHFETAGIVLQEARSDTRQCAGTHFHSHAVAPGQHPRIITHVHTMCGINHRMNASLAPFSVEAVG